MQGMQLLLRLANAAKRYAVQTPVVQSSRNLCCRHELHSPRRAICKPKPGVTRLEPLYAKAQTRLYSVQSYKGGVRDGRKLQKGSKNVTQIGA